MAAVLEGNRALSQWVGQLDIPHSASLLAGIAECCKNAGITQKQIELISIGIGPGMFTGLRVGVTTAKFLAEGLACSVAPVSSLAALALQTLPLASAANARRIWTLSDARSSRVYAYCRDLSEISPELRAREEEAIAIFPQELVPQLQKGDFLIGAGAELYRSIWPAHTICPANAAAHQLQAPAIGQIGFSIWNAEATISPLELEPRYLKTGQNHLP